MNQKIYEKFAHVLVEVGVNFQPGEIAVVQAEPEHQALVREVTRACYQCGARYVWIEYTDEETDRIRAEASKPEYLDFYPQWLSDMRRTYGGDKISMIRLFTPRPRFGEQPGKALQAVQTADRKCRAAYRKAAGSGRVSSTLTAVPGQEWARTVFPELEPAEALKKLWDVYIKVCRLDEPDPVAAWKAHREKTLEKRTILDRLDLTALYLKGPGTDMRVGLIGGGHWLGACDQNMRTGLPYIPNIPTEEIFIVPNKWDINGVVSSTLPLNYKGALIEGIRLEVKDGRVVSGTAERGGEILDTILDTDEGSRYFGEIAMVSVQSPIYQSGLTFFDTLLDENAVCHMALGRGTPEVLDGGYELSPEEQNKRGINDCAIHVDFMIGSDRFNVDGETKDGKRVAILRNGDWVI